MSQSKSIIKEYYTFLENKEWAVSAQELAEAATRFGVELGILQSGKVLTERLIKDYVQRGVIEKPQRQGKEAVYNTGHLDQLLEARQLINTGVKLNALPSFMESDQVKNIRFEPSNFHQVTRVAQEAFNQIKNKYRSQPVSGSYLPLLGTASTGGLASDEGLEDDLQNYDLNNESKESENKKNQNQKNISQVEEVRYKLETGISLIIEKGRHEKLQPEQIEQILESIEKILKK